MVNGYLDSILHKKKIYKYSKGKASTAYQLQFDNLDTCKLIGYHESAELPLLEKVNSTYHYGYDRQQYWIITPINKTEIEIKEFVDTTYFKTFRADPKTYHYRKSKDGLPSDIKPYIIEKLFVGKYRNEDTGDTIKFTSEKKILNFANYTSFDIITDFWEYTPGSYDVIELYEAENSTAEVYHHWEFKGDYLFIYRLEGDYDDDSGFFKADVDELIYKLLKI